MKLKAELRNKLRKHYVGLCKTINLKRILLIRFSSIGDIVLITPIIRCLKKQYPDVEISFLTKDEYVPILEANPYINFIYSFKSSLREVIPFLKAADFDLVIDLHKNLRSFFVKINLRRKSISFNKLNIKKWLKVNFKINSLPEIHIVDRYFFALKRLKIKNDGQGLDYFIPNKDAVDLKALPAVCNSGFYAIVIGAKHFTKRFPIDKQIELIDNLKLPIVLFGDQAEYDDGEIIKKKTQNKVFNACGLFNINQSASLLKLAKKVITNDTGLMHIASALNKDIISIWGSTIPEFGMYPYQLKKPKNQIKYVQIQNLSCRPCSKIGLSECPKEHFECMNNIKVEEIVAAL